MNEEIEPKIEKISREELTDHFLYTENEIKKQGNLYMTNYIDKLHANAHFVVVRGNNENLIGIIAFYANRGDKAFISHVWVHEDFRRKGICNAMLTLIESYLNNIDFHSVSLEVKKNNTSAISSYVKSGFNVINETDNSFIMEKLMN